MKVTATQIKQAGFVQGALLIGIALLAVVIFAFSASSADSGMTISPHEAKAVGSAIDAQAITAKNATINLQAASPTSEWDGVAFNTSNGRITLVQGVTPVDVPGVTREMTSVVKKLNDQQVKFIGNKTNGVWTGFTSVPMDVCKSITSTESAAAAPDIAAAATAIGAAFNNGSSAILRSSSTGGLSIANGCHWKTGDTTGTYVKSLLQPAV